MKLSIERDNNGKIKTKEQPQVYLPRCAYYTHFPSFFEKNSDSYNTYHRSAEKKLKNVKNNQFAFKGNQSAMTSGMSPKTGNFYNPFHFPDYKNAVIPEEIAPSNTAKAFWYDKLLNFLKANAKSVVESLPETDNFKINQDHDYPCVLFSITQPGRLEKNIKIWTHFISIYFIAIANKLANERGINIETVRRSSFDTIRPSVAECGQSLRVSLGLSPKSYHQCVIDTINYLKILFENSTVFDIPADPKQTLSKVISKYNNIKKSNIQLKNTLWETLWANADSGNRSFVTQIFRREHVVNVIIDDILNAMGEHSIKDIFSSDELKKSCFARPMVSYLENLICVKDVLTTNYTDKELQAFQWKKTVKFKNNPFWLLIREFGKAIHANPLEIEEICQTKRNYGELYHYLESWLINFNFHPRKYQDVTDGYGSDSDTEANLLISNQTQKIYAKKFITATGMRAIQLSYACAKRFLETEQLTHPVDIEADVKKMYYETSDAIRKFSIPYTVNENCEDGIKKNRQHIIHFFDLNHCNAQQLNEPENLVKITKNHLICILDATSATTQETHAHLKKIWQENPELQIILVVSSGLKNEQAMSDYNPYGSIRIFTKTQDHLEEIYNDLVVIENHAQYAHPQKSHILRKNAKDAGFTPTNQSILAPNP